MTTPNNVPELSDLTLLSIDRCRKMLGVSRQFIVESVENKKIGVVWISENRYKIALGELRRFITSHQAA